MERNSYFIARTHLFRISRLPLKQINLIVHRIPSNNNKQKQQYIHIKIEIGRKRKKRRKSLGIAIRGDMNVTDFPAMGLVGLDVGAPVRVPQSERPVLAAAKAVVAVGVESHRQNAALVAMEHGRLLRRQLRRASRHVAGASATYDRTPGRYPLREKKNMHFLGCKNPTGFGFGDEPNRTDIKPQYFVFFTEKERNVFYLLTGGRSNYR